MSVSIVIVIPATAGREANLAAVLESLDAQRNLPRVVVVDDGGTLNLADFSERERVLDVLRVPKHQPGLEQPRNIGVRHAETLGATHVWFVDSDVVVVPDALARIEEALEANPGRVLVAPYEWLGGERPESANFWAKAAKLRNDPRWGMFNASPPDRLYVDDLSAGLACWSGNLVWPVEEFKRVGGFWSEIHHGRCEDGELGLRAVSMQVPISFVAEARGFHLAHPINHALIVQRNARDVPMLNKRHPWVEGSNIFLSERDGGAFEVRCPCGAVVGTNSWWDHASHCSATGIELPVSRS